MTLEIERSRLGGRGLVQDGRSPAEPSWPQVAADAVRSIAHLTMTTAPIPALTVYEVLGDLKQIGHVLPQVLDQLTSGLARSLRMLETYDHAATTPEESVERARADLQLAAGTAQLLGQHLERAQAALSAQGYHAPDEPHGTVPASMRPGPGEHPRPGPGPARSRPAPDELTTDGAGDRRPDTPPSAGTRVQNTRRSDPRMTPHPRPHRDVPR